MSTPVDIEFELLVMACSIQLLESLLRNRFKTTQEEDQALLKNDELSFRMRTAITYRM
jgi:hypothetical protein